MKLLDVNLLKENPDESARYDSVRAELERTGQFNVDENENSLDGCEPVDEHFPFIRKGFKYAVKHKFYLSAMKLYCKKVNKELTNLKIEGKQNLKGVKAAIITCNHISKVDSFAVRAAAGMDIMFVAAEFNNWAGPMGDIARHTGYIPISSTLNKTLLRKFDEAITYYLNKNKKILIYPEQAMWREYTKPRPLKTGAYHYAAKNNVPVVPMFITITEKAQKVDEQNRLNFGDYTIHIMPAIYPKQGLSVKENEKYMKLENFRLWKECYEKTYNLPLTYNTAPDVWNKLYSEEYGNLKAKKANN